SSRDLLMSQFWQNLQARLQPAVPNDSTGVPGRKWFRGFFSIGSTQNPLDRPQVVSTIRSFSRARTKQSPRCPSSSLQNRGQRSHWTRPLSSACQYFVGTVPAVMGASFMMEKTKGRRGGFPGVLSRPVPLRSLPCRWPSEGGRITRRKSPVSLYVVPQHRCSAQINSAPPHFILQAAPHHPHLVACRLAASLLVIQEGQLLTGTTANGNGLRRLSLPEMEAKQVDQIEEEVFHQAVL